MNRIDKHMDSCTVNPKHGLQDGLPDGKPDIWTDNRMDTESDNGLPDAKEKRHEK